MCKNHMDLVFNFLVCIQLSSYYDLFCKRNNAHVYFFYFTGLYKRELPKNPISNSLKTFAIP
jgi:hypothetical protein